MSMLDFVLLRRCALVLFAALLGTQPNVASAQDYPNRPIRFIVPFTPGAGADTVARLLAQHLFPLLGQPIVVENRGGASGMIGTDIAAKAPPDGYTWVFGHDPAFTINPHLRKMPYDALRDFSPVSLLTRVPLVLVANPSLGLIDLAGLITLAQKNPGKLTIASSGNGTSGHLAAEVLMNATQIKLLHVPYKGQAEAVMDAVSGRTDLNFSAIPNILSLAQSAKLTVIANGSSKRFSGLPNVMTVAESGFAGFDVSAWHGLLMPTGVSADIIQKVNGLVNLVLQNPEVANKLSSLGLYPIGGSPDVLAQLLKTDSERWANVIREANIRED